MQNYLAIFLLISISYLVIFIYIFFGRLAQMMNREIYYTILYSEDCYDIYDDFKPVFCELKNSNVFTYSGIFGMLLLMSIVIFMWIWGIWKRIENIINTIKYNYNNHKKKKLELWDQ